MKPTLGRIVHYLEDGQVYTAMIVWVDLDFFSQDRVNLAVWNDLGEQSSRIGAEFSPQLAMEDRKWFWPRMPHQVKGESK